MTVRSFKKFRARLDVRDDDFSSEATRFYDWFFDLET